MSADLIVSSVLIRLRHPVHESGLTNVFDASTQEWFVDADGKATPLPEKGPFTPQQLEAKGLTLPVIMSQAVQTAMRDRVDALAQATGANEERDIARAETREANAARDTALARIAELEAQLEAKSSKAASDEEISKAEEVAES